MEDGKQASTTAEAPQAEEPKYDKGFITSYWYLAKATDASGYDVKGIKASLEKVTETINFANHDAFLKESADFPTEHFASQFKGKVKIETAGKYTFQTTSHDGSRLWVNEKKVVDNWGFGTETRRGRIYLKAGYHDIKVTHFENDKVTDGDNGEGAQLLVKYKGEDTKGQWTPLEGWHDAADKKQEEPVPKAAAGEEDINEGFIAKYYFFDTDSGFDGYDTDGV